MPLYEYRCEACDHRFEILQRRGEPADGLACPQCGVQQLEKMFSTFAAAATQGSTAASAPGPGCGPGAPT